MVENFEIFPHLLNPACYKILRLHVSKIVFFIENLLLVLEMAILERFGINIVKNLYRLPLNGHCPLRGQNGFQAGTCGLNFL